MAHSAEQVDRGGMEAVRRGEGFLPRLNFFVFFFFVFFLLDFCHRL
jgi:hypothetical protein